MKMSKTERKRKEGTDMEKHPVKRDFVSAGESVSLSEYYRKRKRFFAVFLICAAMLVAGFAVSYAWGEGGSAWKDRDGAPPETGSEENGTTEPAPSDRTEDTGALSESALSTESEGEAVPDDPTAGTPILSMTLSSPHGETYINNESIQAYDYRALLEADVSCEIGEAPLVLILHTHTSEGYAKEGSALIEGILGEVTYTKDPAQSVLSVGEVLCHTLKENGISAIHCRTVHDAEGLKGAYATAAESVRFFLSHYPSIMYVIDLHRDAILTSEGEYVRAVTYANGEALAQVMAVVGSDGNGTKHERWKESLALAEQLCRSLNADVPTLCRPTVLRNASYNQELSPYSLLLEIGTGGNSVEEAKRSAVLVGKALATLIRGR
ncbi:MAG: hypothetical protein E7643_06190 [Ruminococcaceae bacterium]|nr:hypothetical protein [Oscillospiraceae bacterium]